MLYAAYAWIQFVLNALLSLSTVVKSNEISKNALHILSSSPILYKDILIGIFKKITNRIHFFFSLSFEHIEHKYCWNDKHKSMLCLGGIQSFQQQS